VSHFAFDDRDAIAMDCAGAREERGRCPGDAAEAAHARHAFREKYRDVPHIGK
jgi:hypothetical protein